MNKQLIKVMISGLLPMIKQKLKDNGGSFKFESEDLEKIFEELGLKSSVILNDNKMEITINE